MPFDTEPAPISLTPRGEVYCQLAASVEAGAPDLKPYVSFEYWVRREPLGCWRFGAVEPNAVNREALTLVLAHLGFVVRSADPSIEAGSFEVIARPSGPGRYDPVIASWHMSDADRAALAVSK